MLMETLHQDIESWEEELADFFVIDSAGHFAKIGSGTLRTQHVFHVTRKCLGQCQAWFCFVVVTDC